LPDAERQESAQPLLLSKSASEREKKAKAKSAIAVEHVDIFKDVFWDQRPWILGGRAGKVKAAPPDGRVRVMIAPVH
jgi:tRNA(His) guanylyltransferase